MIRAFLIFVVIIAITFAVVGLLRECTTPPPLPTPTATLSPTETVAPTDVPTAMPTFTPSPTETPKPTQTSRPTATVAPTTIPTDTPTPTKVGCNCWGGDEYFEKYPGCAGMCGWSKDD